MASESQCTANSNVILRMNNRTSHRRRRLTNTFPLFQYLPVFGCTPLRPRLVHWPQRSTRKRSTKAGANYKTKLLNTSGRQSQMQASSWYARLPNRWPITALCRLNVPLRTNDFENDAISYEDLNNQSYERFPISGFTTIFKLTCDAN